MHLEGDRRRGFFLTFEGPEGSGKSTQAQRLAARLTASGTPCVVTREPGGTALGEAIRRILLHAPELSPVPAADALLFNAARAQLVAEVVAPALERGEVVICDRFTDSTLAYQGFGAGQPLEALFLLAKYAVGDLSPDMTVLIDLPVEAGLRRKQPDEVTRFEERADLEFHRRVRDGFLALAASETDRFVVVDGRAGIEEIEDSVFEALWPRLWPGVELPVRNTASAPDGPSLDESEPEASSLRMNR